MKSSPPAGADFTDTGMRQAAPATVRVNADPIERFIPSENAEDSLERKAATWHKIGAAIAKI